MNSTKPGFTLWFTGLSGAGKSTVGDLVYEELKSCHNLPVEMLDGDEVRTNLSAGLGFSRQDRDINIHRIAYVAGLLNRHGVNVLVAAISPYKDTREQVRQRIGPHFIEVYVKCPIDVCIKRDVKGLYKKALAGEIQQFTGISDPYEAPLSPEIVLNTASTSPQVSAEQVMAFLERNRYL